MSPARQVAAAGARIVTAGVLLGSAAGRMSSGSAVTIAVLRSPRPDVIPLKARDAFVTVFFIDPIVVPVVVRMVNLRWITPNRLSIASVVIALAGGVLFAFGRLVEGAIATELAFVVDCMDGKLANLRAERSAMGGLIDLTGDCVRVVGCSAGLAVGLGGDALAAGLVAAFIGLRFTVAVIATNRPQQRDDEALVVPARAIALLRVARRRSAPPATTVEAEAAGFALGPIVGLPVAGLVVAVGLELLASTKFFLDAVHATRRTARDERAEASPAGNQLL
jgi:phosphatidylglycerophosphate synthase